MISSFGETTFCSHASHRLSCQRTFSGANIRSAKGIVAVVEEDAPPAASWRVCSGINEEDDTARSRRREEKRCSMAYSAAWRARGPQLGPNIRPWCARRAR